VCATIEEAHAGNFAGEPYIGDLENGGVSLAVGRAEVPQELQAQPQALQAQCSPAAIPVDTPSAPGPGRDPARRPGGHQGDRAAAVPGAVPHPHPPGPGARPDTGGPPRHRSQWSSPVKLELRGITKRFGSLVANDAIDLVVEPGEIHALLGENGAGKSTLMNVLYGLYEPDDGQIVLDGTPVTFDGPGDAVAAGIGMVHQHFMLVPVFTVAESVALGYEPAGPLGIIDRREARKRVKEISDRFGFDVDPDAVIEDLPVGVQQRVEIIKALSRDAKVLILDEPTAVLTPQETDELIAIMRQLKAEGTSIVFITHKLREVRAIADSITVIRRGTVVGEASPASSETELASLMVGRSVSMAVDKDHAAPGEESFVVTDLSVLDTKGQVAVDRLDLTVRHGEIVVVAGVQGNGQTELTETILGLVEPVSGSIVLDGKELVGSSVKQRLRAGIGFVPEDRSTGGVIAGFTVAENFILDLYDTEPFAAFGSLRPGVV